MNRNSTFQTLSTHMFENGTSQVSTQNVNRARNNKKQVLWHISANPKRCVKISVLTHRDVLSIIDQYVCLLSANSLSEIREHLSQCIKQTVGKSGSPPSGGHLVARHHLYSRFQCPMYPMCSLLHLETPSLGLRICRIRFQGSWNCCY